MAATKPFNISIEGVEKFTFALDRFGELVEFLGKNTWEEVAGVFFDEEEKIFDSEGAPEKFLPLSPGYAARKARTHPGKPIMQRDGFLKDAATGKGSTPGKAQTIKRIIQCKDIQGVTVGVSSRHGKAHQLGLGNLPVRKFIQTTSAEKIKFAKVLQAALVRVERESFGGLKK